MALCLVKKSTKNLLRNDLQDQLAGLSNLPAGVFDIRASTLLLGSSLRSRDGKVLHAEYVVAMGGKGPLVICHQMLHRLDRSLHRPARARHLSARLRAASRVVVREPTLSEDCTPR